MSVLSVDLGGSHATAGVVSRGRVLASATFDTDGGSLEKLLPDLAAILRESCRVAGISLEDCEGMGVGFPGVVDRSGCEILSTLGKFEDVNANHLHAWCTQEFGLPMKIENDARLALLGEHLAGAARGSRDAVMVTLGTGIGVGAMLDGSLIHSRLGQAGTISGHIPVRIGGRKCLCGGIGCAEAEASTWALSTICAEWPGFDQSLLAREKVLDFATLFRVKDAGDRVATEILAHCIGVWSTLAVSLIHAYGPEALLFGGGVMRRGEEILGPVRNYVTQYTWRTRRGIADVRLSELGADAALIGAEALFCEDAR